MRMKTMNQTMSYPAPVSRHRSEPRVRRGAVDRRPLILIGLGVVVAVLIVVVVWRLDQRPERSNLKRMVDLDRIAVPSTPTEDEFARPAAELDRDVMASLRDGASVQVAGEDGALAQEYGAVRIDPLPDAWVEMQRPWARLHPRNGRVVEMRAIAGTMRVPNQAIESGRLEGDVEIRIYEPPVDGMDAPLEDQAPAVTIEAESAVYDAAAGEIHSPRAVRVTTPEATFAGEDLRILFEDDGTRISQLTVERATEPILIRPSRRLPATEAVSKSLPISKPVDVAGATTASRTTGGADRAATEVASAADAWSAREPDAAVRSNTGGSGPSSRSQAAPAVADPEAWYRLVLEDEVVVERVVRDVNGGTMRSTVSGDRLVATFTLGDSGLEGGPIAGGPVRGSGMSPTPSNLVAVTAAAFGPAEPMVPRLDDEVVRVHYTGRLVMVPDPAAAVRMTGDGDSEIIIESNDGRGIELADDGNAAVGSCARLEYRSASERIELVGDEANPLRIESPRFSLAGGRFWMVRSEGTGGLIGPGRMRFAPDTAMQVRTAFGTAAERFVHGLETMLAAGPGADRVVAWAAVAAIGQESTPVDADVPPRLEIEWEGGVDLDFDDLDDDGRLQQARFEGDVRVASDDFKLGSQALVVDFADGGEVDSIERILATGGARVDRVGEIGSLEAASIDLGLQRTEDGRTVPTEMIAEGDVEASDPGQTMWTDRLVVRFRPRAEEEEGDGVADGGGFGGDEMGAVEITRVDAADGVQVRLEEGARVFADRLEGDGVARTLQLTGDDVMVLRSNVVADRLRDVRFDDATRAVRGTGPGRFRYYDADVVPASRDRIERPRPASRTSLAATWTQAMRYDERANDGAGRLDLEGDVRVRSTPDALTSDRLDAREVSLDLANRVGGVRPAGERSEGLLADEGGKDLKRLVARGDAVMESRTWKTAARRGDPRLFRVEGARVEYLVASREALVEGAGGLLVHDPESSTAPEDRGPASTAGFGIDGTSRFRWARRMTMNREIDDRYLVVMEREVEVLHAGLQPEDMLSLTADRLEVTIERPDDAKPARSKEQATEQNPKQEPKQELLDSSGVELGGPADLVRVRGIGRVFVRTPEHDVECSEFDYNVDTQIAMLRADPGRVVTVQSKGVATPIRAERVQWDLRTGRIRILGGEGAISR